MRGCGRLRAHCVDFPKAHVSTSTPASCRDSLFRARLTMPTQSRRFSRTTGWPSLKGRQASGASTCIGASHLSRRRLKHSSASRRENAADTSRMLVELHKTATILEGHLGSSLGLRLLDKNSTFQFFSYLFNLEEWAAQDRLRGDTGVDRQIVKNPVAWHSDHIQVGKRHVQMFSLKATPEASRPCLFSGLLRLDCDSVLCSTWRVKSTSAARGEIDAQEKFISFFKVGVLTRVMGGRDFASLETGAGARAANTNVDDLSEVIRSLDKKAQGEYSLPPACGRANTAGRATRYHRPLCIGSSSMPARK